MKILKKLSVKTMASVNLKELTAETAVMRVIGLVRSYEQGETQFGTFYAFKGEFMGTDLATGEQGIAPTAFMPSPLDQSLKALIDGAVEKVQEEVKGDDGKVKQGKRVFAKGDIEVAFDIYARPDETTTIGYQYVLRTVEDVKVSNPLEALAKKIQGKAPLAIAASMINDADPQAEKPAEEVAKPKGKK